MLLVEPDMGVGTWTAPWQQQSLGVCCGDSSCSVNKRCWEGNNGIAYLQLMQQQICGGQPGTSGAATRTSQYTGVQVVPLADWCVWVLQAPED
jgi:hypothetical protein